MPGTVSPTPTQYNTLYFNGGGYATPPNEGEAISLDLEEGFNEDDWIVTAVIETSDAVDAASNEINIEEENDSINNQPDGGE